MNKELMAKAKAVGDVSRLAAYLSSAKRAELELRLRKNDKTSRQLAIPPRPNRGSGPLSFGQQRIWFLDQLDPNSAVYITFHAVSMAGTLKVGALQKALDAIVARHESLRTIFVYVNGIPEQVIPEKRSLELSVVDLTGWPASERETKIQRLLQEEASRPFNLSHDLMLRTRLLRLGEEEHVLLLAIHQIAFDDWSRVVLFRELGAFYSSFVRATSVSIPPLPIQYADFSSWQRQWPQDDVLEEQLSYWKLQLGDDLPVLELPTDHPRPVAQTFRGAAQSRLLPASLWDALRRLSHAEGCTLFMTLLTAFKALLHRYTGQEDILVGTLITGRNRVELEGLIGFFVNTLVLRTDLSGDPTLGELLGRVREVTLGAYANPDLPFEKLVEELQPERRLSHTPLFQVMFVLESSPAPQLELPGIDVGRLEIDRGIAQFDLTLKVIENAEGLTCVCEHNLDLFDATTITRMLGHFQTGLEGIVANPDERLSRLALLTGAECQQLLVTWNNTEFEFPKDRCLHQLFEAQVKQSPDAVAVVFEDQRLTYSELNAQANQLAHHLKKRGVGPDVLVGIHMEQSLEMIVGLLGVLKAGGAYVPLESKYPKERLDFMLDDTRVSIVLTQARLRSDHLARRAELVCLDSGRSILAQESKEDPASKTAPENLVCALYTSGSTGKPKGVMVTHGSLVNAYLAWEDAYQLGSKATTCHLQMASFSFDVFAGDLSRALCSGAKLILCPPVAPRRELYELMCREKVDCAEFVPVSLRTLIQYLRETGQSLAFMRLLVAGSDSWYVNEYQEIRSFCGAETRIINSYGVTEATVDSSYFESCRASIPMDGLVPIGRPFANTQLYLLDTRLQLVPIGVPGELHIGGAGLARGYLNNPELTAEKFIPDPFSNEPGARLYKTGDLARYLPDGNVGLLGRIDNQVKIRGFRIEVGEVETVLRRHPAVREALVLAREEGPNSKRLVAYLVVGPLPAPTITELRSFLIERLPEYMVPSAFMFMEAFPVTPNGKLNRLALPMPSHGRPEIDKVFLWPRDMLELQLAAIWENVLEVKPIGVKDNFFELGGHSLLAVHLFAQIERTFGKNLPLATLFRAPTIEQLADILRQQGWSTPSRSLVAIQPHGHNPPFFIVHAIGGHILGYHELTRRLGSDQPVYGLQAQGLDGKRAAHISIREMANYYIEEIRTVLPEGPYLLGGYSLGGTVAFEMARQLEAQGRKIALLALLETYAPISPNLFDKIQLLGSKVSHFARRVPYHWGHLSRLRSQEKLNYIRQVKSRIWPSAEQFRTDIPPSLPNVFQIVRESIYQAEEEYVPQAYQGRITLFRGSERPQRADPGPDLGWGELAAGGVDVLDVPGDHVTMLEEPHVRVLADKLKTCFEKARLNGRGTPK